MIFIDLNLFCIFKALTFENERTGKYILNMIFKRAS